LTMHGKLATSSSSSSSLFFFLIKKIVGDIWASWGLYN